MKALCLNALLLVSAASAQQKVANDLYPRGQEGNLLAKPGAVVNAAPTPLAGGGWLYQGLPPEATPRPLEKHSIVTVLVDYRSVTLAEGTGETNKIGVFNAVLSDWIEFDGKDVFPALQRRGDPTIAGTLNSQLNAETELEQRESLTLEMAVSIIDIRPNGNLVLEGRREVIVNEEVWMVYLTGETARESIGPDRRVRDTSIAHLQIKKFEKGLVRDGVARGWLSRWYGKYKAF